MGIEKGGGESMSTVGLWLLTTHLIGDFPLQPDWIARTKTENNTRLFIHVMVHVLLFLPLAWYLFPGDLNTQFVFLFWIGASHATIDFRRWVEPKESWNNPIAWVWLNDQILHLIALSLAVPIAELGLWG